MTRAYFLNADNGLRVKSRMIHSVFNALYQANIDAQKLPHVCLLASRMANDPAGREVSLDAGQYLLSWLSCLGNDALKEIQKYFSKYL